MSPAAQGLRGHSGDVDVRHAQQPGALAMRLDRHLGARIGNGFCIGAAVHVVGNGNGLLSAKACVGIGGQCLEHIGVLQHQLFAQFEFLDRLGVWLGAIGRRSRRMRGQCHSQCE